MKEIGVKLWTEATGEDKKCNIESIKNDELVL